MQSNVCLHISYVDTIKISIEDPPAVRETMFDSVPALFPLSQMRTDFTLESN